MRVAITASIAALAIGAIWSASLRKALPRARTLREMFASCCPRPPAAAPMSSPGRSPTSSRRLGLTALRQKPAGASGTIGTLEVSRAPKDGYTYLSATFGQAVGPDPLTPPGEIHREGFEPVVMFGTTPSVVLMAPSTRINSIHELIKYAKKRTRKN